MQGSHLLAAKDKSVALTIRSAEVAGSGMWIRKRHFFESEL